MDYMCDNYVTFIKIRRIVDIPCGMFTISPTKERSFYSEESTEKQMETCLRRVFGGNNGNHHVPSKHAGSDVVLSEC